MAGTWIRLFGDSVVLSTSNDRWYFSLSSSGEFSVKDTRLAIDDLVLPSHSEPTSPLLPVCFSDEEVSIIVVISMFSISGGFDRVCRWWEIDFQLWRSFSEWDEWFSSIRLPGSVKGFLEGVFYVACYSRGLAASAIRSHTCWDRDSTNSGYSVLGNLQAQCLSAVITVFLLATGFLTSGGFGVAAVTVLSWIYKYATGGHPPGADSLDQARDKLGYKAREMKGRAEHATGMGQHQGGGGLGMGHHRADM
ncbi:oleosin 1-like protein [Tanacetum coccineum]